MSDAWLRLRGVTKAYGGVPALRGIDLDVAAGEILVLLGPSGGGKTTLLRLIAGLEAADAGAISLAGEALAGQPVHERHFGFVFQDYALFPHLNVRQNIAFGLRLAGLPAAAQAARVAEMLDLVNLTALADRPVQGLSGGERQRVALARSLAPRPRLLLLDEPLGALDRALRERLMLELRSLLKQAAAGVTAIYVTHDQAEAFAVADRIAILDDGKVVQVAAPRVLYQAPRTPFVARFLGMANILPATITSAAPLRAQTVLGELTAAGPALPPGTTAPLLIRPEAGRPAAAGDDANVIKARVTGASFRGRYTLLQLQAADVDLRLEWAAELPLPAVGTVISVFLAPHSLSLLESG